VPAATTQDSPARGGAAAPGGPPQPPGTSKDWADRWAQLVADGVKFVQKEDVIPAAADRWVFSLAPAVALVPYIALFVVIPFSDSIWAENLDVGIFFVLAMASVSVIGVLMAGWSSANKFSLIGALRAAAQLISYELPIVLAAAAIVMQAGTMSLLGIVNAQDSYWYILTQPVGFFIFVVASLAELTRPPFDMPITDPEIIFGAYTEYTGLKFAFFLLAEYGGIVALSAIASVLFLGGYLPLPAMEFIPEPLWMLPNGEGIGYGLFKLDPATGTVEPVVKDLAMPNGIIFSPDESRLYVADTGGHERHPNPEFRKLPAGIHCYELSDDGKLGKKLFQIEQGSDGMKVDVRGNLYTTNGGKVQIYSADGKKLEQIDVPEGPANVCFGGDDLRTLFITAHTSLYSIRMKLPGAKPVGAKW
jgi:formate hydrogenlyase subunit 4